MNRLNLDPVIEKIIRVLQAHKLPSPGEYCRFLRDSPERNRKLGNNEYGCADAVNIRYSLGMPGAEPGEREETIRVLQAFQDPESGLFQERDHHPFHTTAHCVAALEILDAVPLHPVRALEQYESPEGIRTLLESLDWRGNPWEQSHRGAGVFAALLILHRGGLAWQDAYFDWLDRHNDPQRGLGLRDAFGEQPLCHHLNGWFHYLFNYLAARRPFPHPEALIDTCLELYHREALGEPPQVIFARECSFREIDWIFAIHRASRQTPHRHAECRELLRDCAGRFVSYLASADEAADEGMNDLHRLFGAVCALAELQLALPGKLCSTVPLRNVLDRRPFI